MRKAMMVVLGAALAALSATPALSCLTTPYQTWGAITLALPKAKLSKAELAKVEELRTKAFALLLEARKDGGQLDTAKYLKAQELTRQAIKVVGLIPVAGEPLRRCGVTYRLKDELVDAQ